MGQSFLDRVVAYLRFCAVKTALYLILAQFIIFLICSILENSFAPADLLDCSAAIWAGQIWRPFTAIFTHVDGAHFFFNMLLLFFLGRWFTETLSRAQFWSAIIICGSVANLLHTLLFPQQAVIGFSGALFALSVATAIKAPKTQMLFFPAWLAISVIVFLNFIYFLNSLRPESTSNTAYDVHLFGALCGAAMMWAQPLLKRYQKQWVRRRDHLAQEKDQQAAQRVDEILEKISKTGLHTLSDEERKFLKRHSENERKKQS